MSERYTRLSSLPNNLYLDGSPLLILAGALLKDNRSGGVLVQLKLQNLYHASLTACKVHVKSFDPSGTEVEGVESFSYLDLQVPCGANFGSQTPIFLPDSTTRRVSACVIQAVFEDGNVWQSPVGEWPQAKLRSQLLSDRFQDSELIKQYETEVGGNCKFVPETVGGLFLCTCGTINLANRKRCCGCNRDFDKLVFALDTRYLTQKKEARLAQEYADRAEREREKRIAVAAAKKRKKRIAIIVSAAAILVIAITAFMKLIIIPGNQYKAAEELLATEDYDEAIVAFDALGDYKDAAERKEEAVRLKTEAARKKAEEARKKAEEDNQRAYARAEEVLASGDRAYAAICFGKIDTYRDAHARSRELWNEIAERATIDAGFDFLVGLRADGTVAAVGRNTDNRCETNAWRDIVAVATGDFHTVGLRADGTVIAVGFNKQGQCNTESWTDIVAVAADGAYTVGLRADGTVVAVGDNQYGQCNTEEWTDIVAVTTNGGHTVGLRADGTVVAVGDNQYGQCNTEAWTDITAVFAAGDGHTVGLRADGTVVAVGNNEYGQCNTEAWTDIAAVSIGSEYTVGLRTDGTVVAVGNNENGKCNTETWTSIVAVSASYRHTTGLHEDGTVVAAGDNMHGECDIESWTDIAAVTGELWYTIGLRTDGTVVVAGRSPDYVQDGVSGWTNIKLPS